MRLNAHILMDELEKQYSVTYYGPEVTQIHLKRPEIYNIYQMGHPFKKNRTYCLSTDILPEKPIDEPGTLLICIGYEIPDRYRMGDIRCIWLQDDPIHIIEIFNTVQQIFDKYDDWEYQLQSILNSSASIQEMVNCCEDILPNPIVVIDASLRFLGYSQVIDTNPTLQMYRPGKDGKVQLGNLKEYLSFRDIYTKSGPRLYDNSEKHNLAYIWDVWLHDQYIGNMTIPYVLHGKRNSDRWILSILEGYIARALTKYINNPELRANVLRNLFQDLLEDRTLNEKALGTMGSFSGEYLCIQMQFLIKTKYSQPISYYCSYVENALPHSVCFAHTACIVAFTDISEPGWKEGLLPALEHISQEINLRIGISNSFSNLSHTKYYYQQACAALQLGKETKSDGAVFFFQDHTLSYLLSNVTGTMPLETLYSDGIKRLLEHDAISRVSFTQTLLVYLRNSMNITKTALDLRIHRSSFLERLRNIESLLDMDLDNPRDRLYVQVILERLTLGVDAGTVFMF